MARRRVGTSGLPLVGERLLIDGVDAVRVTFRCEAPQRAQCYLLLNTVTDRSREHIEAFRMDWRDGARELECALPADVILSYQFALCGPSGIDPRVRVDMGSWVRLVEEARPDACNPLRLVNGRGHAASIFVGPDAQMSWPGGDVDAPSMRATREEDIGARVRARIGGGLSRCVVVHDGEQAPTRTLVVFDGDVWRANGVGWLTRRYPGLRVVTIGAGDVEARRRELTDADAVSALLGAVCDVAGVGSVAVAGQSFGGLAVLQAALGGSVPVECFIAQSPSLWWGGDVRGRGEGALMGDLGRGACRSLSGLTIWCQVGAREVAMAPVVERCAALLGECGALVRLERYSGGHDVAWWREGLLAALDEWCV